LKSCLVLPLLVLMVAAGLLASGCQTVKSPLVDRTWVLTSYNGPDNVPHDAAAGATVNATFDSTTGQVTGSGGCNSYGGAFHVDRLNVTVDSIVHTERACLDPALNTQETNFFTALQAAQEFRVGHETLTITGGGWELDFKEKTTP